MNKAIFVLIVGLGIVMTSVPANAFHGAPYQARGLACVGGASPCLEVALVWGGAVGAAGTAQLAFIDPVLRMTVLRVSVPAAESFGALQFGPAVHCGIAEHTTSYSLRDANAGSNVLLVTGAMELCFDGPNAGKRFCDLGGHFLQAFKLEFGCDLPAA